MRKKKMVAVLLVEREHGREHRVAEQKVSVLRALEPLVGSDGHHRGGEREHDRDDHDGDLVGRCEGL